jgi:hypothetical protein
MRRGVVMVRLSCKIDGKDARKGVDVSSSS